MEDFTSKQLHQIWNSLLIKGVKNAKKATMVDNLVETYSNKRSYKTLISGTSDVQNVAPRKEVQCPFRLMNTLFSDAFAGDFADIGKVAGRKLLDSAKAANDEYFWVGVQEAFC